VRKKGEGAGPFGPMPQSARRARIKDIFLFIAFFRVVIYFSMGVFLRVVIVSRVVSKGSYWGSVWVIIINSIIIDFPRSVYVI